MTLFVSPDTVGATTSPARYSTTWLLNATAANDQENVCLLAQCGPAPNAARNTGVRRSEPEFPERRLLVRPWPDPVLDNLGHDPRSRYVEQFWLAVLGPSCLLLVRRLAARLEREPDGFELDSLEWARELGLGMKGGKHGPFWRAIDRACRFQLAQRNGELLVARRRIAPLATGQIKRLPEGLRKAHDQWLEAQRRRPQRRSLTSWSVEHGPADAA